MFFNDGTFNCCYNEWMEYRILNVAFIQIVRIYDKNDTDQVVSLQKFRLGYRFVVSIDRERKSLAGCWTPLCPGRMNEYVDVTARAYNKY